MGADQIVCAWARRRGQNLKPFADEGCPLLIITEFRVLLKIKLSMMSPFSWFFFFFEVLHLFHFCVSRVVVFSVSHGVSRFVHLFCLSAPQLHVNPNLQMVKIPPSLELLQDIGNCGQVAVGRFVRVLVLVSIVLNTGSNLLLIWVYGPLSS